MAWRSRATTAFVAVTLVAPLVAAAVAVVALDRSRLTSAQAPEPVLGAVVGAPRTGETAVSISLRASDVPPVRTSAAGVVTQVHVAPGQELSTGSVLVTVGDGDVVGYVSARPLHVDVTEGSAGPAVGVAQQLLTDLGLYQGPVDGRARSATTRAVVAFNEAHGRGRDRVLSRASLAWLGTGPTRVETVTVRVGDDVGPGSDLLTTAAAYEAIDVKPAGGALPEGDLVLDAHGIVARLDRPTMSVTDAAAVAAVAAAMGPDAATGGDALVRYAEPVERGVVPASAVVTDEAGRTCVFPGVSDEPVPITPLGGSLGTVEVDVRLVGQPVLVNAREVRTDLSCG